MIVGVPLLYLGFALGFALLWAWILSQRQLVLLILGILAVLGVMFIVTRLDRPRNW